MELIFGALTLALAIYCLVGLLNKKQFAQGLKNVSEKDYPMKNLMPIGLFTQKLLGGAGNRLMNALASEDVRRKLARLYGEGKLRFSCIVYTADALTYILLLLTVGCFLTAATGEIALMALILALTVVIVASILPNRLDENIRDRQRSIKLEYPDFLSKFILLLGAGMTVQEAWATASVRPDGADSPLYRELEEVNREMRELGKPVTEALRAFSIRARDADISRFVSSVTQYVEYGGGDLAEILSQQSSEAWKNRKQEALRLGQEAGTKLTGTMILMFLAIVIIVMAPALMNMSAIF